MATMLIVTVSPGCNVPRSHTTPEPVLLHQPCEAVAEAKLIPGCSGWLTITRLAAPGPLFATVTEEVKLLLSVTMSGETVRAMCKSGDGGGGGGVTLAHVVPTRTSSTNVTAGK